MSHALVTYKQHLLYPALHGDAVGKVSHAPVGAEVMLRAAFLSIATGAAARAEAGLRISNADSGLALVSAQNKEEN